MISFPKAKINIGLRITARRPDGYHDIETLFYPLPLCDALEFVVPGHKTGRDELIITGLNIDTKSGSNLVIKILQKVRKIHALPYLKIHLHKAIPAGAGLGGGSSDAACMLLSLNKCFDLALSDVELRKIALEAGSDCPFFLDPVPSYATGRGEIFRSVKAFLEGYWLVLLNPGIRISTREAYINSSPLKPENNLEELVSLDISLWKDLIINDFEKYVFKLYPHIENLKKALYRSGALYSSLSGSGSSVYGIFKEKPELPQYLKDYKIFEGFIR